MRGSIGNMQSRRSARPTAPARLSHQFDQLLLQSPGKARLSMCTAIWCCGAI